MKRMIVAMAGVCLLALRAPAQEERKTYEPGKEHQLLRQFEGDWDFTMRCLMPGQEAKDGRGMETCRLAYGGFWLECDTKGTKMGRDFNGKCIVGFDPQKKKYRGIWLDNWSPFMGRFEGDADSAGKTFTFNLKMGGMKGEGKKDEARREEAKKGEQMGHPEKMVWETKDADHWRICFYGKDNSGKEVLWAEISYARKSAK